MDEGQNTLGDYRHKRKFKAEDGEEGGKRRCHGKDGRDIDLKGSGRNGYYGSGKSGKVIADMSGDNKRQVVLKGRKRRQRQ